MKYALCSIIDLMVTNNRDRVMYTDLTIKIRPLSCKAYCVWKGAI